MYSTILGMVFKNSNRNDAHQTDIQTISPTTECNPWIEKDLEVLKIISVLHEGEIPLLATTLEELSKGPLYEVDN